MATGKTHSRHSRLLVDAIDLSGDARSFGACGIEHVEDAVQGWSDGVINYTLGRKRAFLEGFQAVFNNAVVPNRSHSELSAREEYRASLLFGIRAAPTAGDPCFSAPLEQMNYTIDGDGPVLVNVDFPGPGQGDTIGVSGLFNVWGAILAYAQALTATTNGTAVDNGASSANGALAYLHITVSSGGTWAFKVQDSPDNAIWSDLVSFTINGSTAGSEQVSVTGTVDRYIRLVATRTSGTCTATATIVRL